MITQRQLQGWLENPVTREFVELIVGHKQASHSAVTEIMFMEPKPIDRDLKVERLKGQVFTFDLFETLEALQFFMSERVDNQKKIQETNNE